jgi:DNA repair exonuclease SbcCD ATPase subunit
LDVVAKLNAIADELYGLLPAEFVSARDRHVAEAKGAGDPDLAAAVKKLRRPASGAWLANMLVRERQADLRSLLELGATMRRAQSRFDAADMRRLSKERRQSVAHLVGEAKDLAGDIGLSPTESNVRELEGTLEAALADADAAEALRSGQLVTPISYSGLGPVDLSGAVATSPPRSTDRASTAGQKGKKPGKRSHPGSSSTNRAAKDTVTKAQGVVGRAKKAADAQERIVDKRREERERSRNAIAALEQQLEDLAAADKEAAAALRQAEKDLDGKARALRTATGRLEQAQRTLEQAGTARRRALRTAHPALSTHDRR